MVKYAINTVGKEYNPEFLVSIDEEIFTTTMTESDALLFDTEEAAETTIEKYQEHFAEEFSVVEVF